MHIRILVALIMLSIINVPVAFAAKSKKTTPKITIPKSNANNPELSDVFISTIGGNEAAQSDMAAIIYLASFVDAIQSDEVMGIHLFVKSYKISGNSMQPTLLLGDQVMTNLKYYKNQKPKRGDIVVYEYPEDVSKDMMHRIIAIEGDEIAIKNKKVYLNNEILFEPYLVHLEKDIVPADQNPRDNFGPIKIPKDSYFVMGDNRDRSYDSRFWGVVKLEAIKGKPFFTYWSDVSDRIGMKFK
jgi:signal peptidase I